MKKFFKFLALVIAIFLLVIVTFLVVAPQLAKHGDLSFSNNTRKFTKEILDETCGVALRESDQDYCGENCTKLWNNRNVPTKYDELTFYLFDNSKKANKAFKEVKKSYDGYIEEDGSDYLISEVPGCIDASSIVYVYVHKNLIVEATLFSQSEGPMFEDEVQEVYSPNREELISLIRDNF